MPSTSPISGWAIPLDSDPLANAALAVRNLVDSIEAGWTAYTPAWTAATSNPAVGNGSIVGRYKRFGKTVLFRVNLTIGTTTTLGSGQYSISLPFAAHATGRQILAACDLVSGSVYGIRARIEAAASTAQLWTPGTTAGGGDRAVTGAVPAAIAATAVLVVEGMYEAA